VVGTEICENCICPDLFLLVQVCCYCSEVYNSTVSFHGQILHKKYDLQKVYLLFIHEYKNELYVFRLVRKWQAMGSVCETCKRNVIREKRFDSAGIVFTCY
jgi:hypothetical protein